MVPSVSEDHDRLQRLVRQRALRYPQPGWHVSTRSFTRRHTERFGGQNGSQVPYSPTGGNASVAVPASKVTVVIGHSPEDVHPRGTVAEINIRKENVLAGIGTSGAQHLMLRPNAASVCRTTCRSAANAEVAFERSTAARSPGRSPGRRGTDYDRAAGVAFDYRNAG